jgi:hypothetical protein
LIPFVQQVCVPIASFFWLVATASSSGCASGRYSDSPFSVAAETSLQPQSAPAGELTAAQAEARAEAVRRDPVGYLRQVLENTRRLSQYTVKFVRYERRGLLGRLYGPEHMQCWFRRQPFSVRMKWLDQNAKQAESAYVADATDSKVRFVTRRPVPLLVPPPGVNKVDLRTPVIWGESKYPLTDFGLERLMEQTLQSLEQAQGDVVVTYLGLERSGCDGQAVHHLQLKYPPTRYAVPIQDLYITVATDLPAGTALRYADGQLDAAYYYYDLDTGVNLSDADFLLEAERSASAGRGGGHSAAAPDPHKPAD